MSARSRSTRGRLIAGGAFIHGGEPLVAVDPATGAVDPWDPGTALPQMVDSLAIGPAGDVWAAGFADQPTPGGAIRHYASLGDGGASIARADTGLPRRSAARGLLPIVADVRPRMDRTDPRPLGPGGRHGPGVPRGGLRVRRWRPATGACATAPDGSVDDWDPDLLGVLPFADDAGLMELEPYSLAVLGERLVVGGTFSTVVPNPSGGGSIRAISPMLVFSTTTGSLLRPTDPERVAWFPIQGWNAVAFDMLHTDAGLVVAFGSPGLGVFDATTLDWDATASAPYFDPTWWLPDYGNAIYALALPGSP